MKDPECRYLRERNFHSVGTLDRLHYDTIKVLIGFFPDPEDANVRPPSVGITFLMLMGPGETTFLRVRPVCLFLDP